MTAVISDERLRDLFGALRWSYALKTDPADKEADEAFILALNERLAAAERMAVQIEWSIKTCLISPQSK